MKQHPAPSDLPDPDEPEEHPITPEYWCDDAEVEQSEVEYCDRAPSDWVVSGPLGGAKGPGRRFSSWSAAEKWAREFYGARLKQRVDELCHEESTRWAFVIRGTK